MRLNLDVHAVAFTLALLSLCLHSLPVDAAGEFAAHVTSLDGKAFASGAAAPCAPCVTMTGYMEKNAL